MLFLSALCVLKFSPADSQPLGSVSVFGLVRPLALGQFTRKQEWQRPGL